MKVIARHFLGDRTTIAYPHCNGFCADGTHFVFGRTRGADGEPPLLLIRDLTSGADTELPAFPFAPSATFSEHSTLCFDVALNAPRLAAVFQGCVCVLDLKPGATWRIVYERQTGIVPQDLPGISPDGRFCLMGEDRPGFHAVVEIDLDTAKARTLFGKPWYANHFHYCPHDPSWIGFAHEGPTLQIPDRCWAWHATKAAEGRIVFDQHTASADPAQPLAVGHERWAFHDTSAYVIAYAVSPSPKRGLYEIFSDGRPARLLRESNTAWHCNMDAGGRIAVVDTSAPWDAVPATGDAYAAGVAHHLKVDRERSSNFSDVVLLDLKTGQDLPVARVLRTQHPYHPHPALSLDGKWLTYTDATPEKKGSWLVELGSD